MPNMVFLMENMIDVEKHQLVKVKCGFTDGLCLSSIGLSGGIDFRWSELNVKLISYSVHHIAVEVWEDSDAPLWAAVRIYGWPATSNKHLSWALMKEIRCAILILMIFFGDINKILHALEERRWCG